MIVLERLDLVLHFRDNRMVDFLAPLDLNHEKRPLGLDQKINLASLPTLRPLLHVRGSRKNERPAKAQHRKEFLHMVQDQVLKLKAQPNMPSLKLLQRREIKKSVLNRGFPRLNIMQIEADVVVLDSIPHLPEGLPRLRIESTIAGYKAGQLKIAKYLGVIST